MSSSSTPRAEVEIVSHLPSGKIRYREGANVHSFDMELGSGDVVVIIYVPAPTAWDATLPWAAGRRAAVLDTVARAVRREHCRGCRIEVSERWIHLSERWGRDRVIGALRRIFGRS